MKEIIIKLIDKIFSEGFAIFLLLFFIFVVLPIVVMLFKS